MPSVFPSYVVRMIEIAFPWAASVNAPRPCSLDGPVLTALVDLLERLPEATLTLAPKGYSEYVTQGCLR